MPDPDPTHRATFAFRGHVTKVRAATMPDVPVDERTAVVHVEEIIYAPDVLLDWADRDITVQVGSEKPAVAKGERAVFFANGFIFGAGLCVVSIDHVPVADAV